MSIAIIILIGLIAYVAEEDLKDVIARRERREKVEKRFEAMIAQSYRSLAACESLEDYLKVSNCWIRRLMREFGDTYEHLLKISLLIDDVFDACKKRQIEESFFNPQNTKQ